jgi:hypothetical protein
VNQDLINEVLQWVGAVFIIAMHVLNSAQEYGYAVRPYNIVTGALGTICFMAWSIRVDNSPQLIVNVVALIICATGLYKALRKNG